MEKANQGTIILRENFGTRNSDTSTVYFTN